MADVHCNQRHCSSWNEGCTAGKVYIGPGGDCEQGSDEYRERREKQAQQALAAHHRGVKIEIQQGWVFSDSLDPQGR